MENCLKYLHNKIQTIRLKNKTKEDYNEVDILLKCSFKMLDIDFPNGPFVFKSNPEYKIYLDKIIEEFVILAFYMNYKELGLRLSDNLILDPKCKIGPHQIIGNQRFYLEPLKTIKRKKIDVNLPEKRFAMNPSILKTDDGYIINCRIINYQLNDTGRYIIYHPSGKIITENIIIHTNKYLHEISQYVLHDVSQCIEFKKNIQGLEDLILFKHNSDLWFTCTNLESNPHGLPQINLCRLKFESDKYLVTEKYPIELPSNRGEKNWLPVIHKNHLKLIYEYHPYTIKEISDELIHGKVIKVNNILSGKYNLNLSRFKGSAAPIEFEDGYLIIVHETFNLPSGLRCYLHRFIWLNDTLEIKKMSHPWYFQHHGIEFCRAMVRSHIEDEIILSYSIHDKDAQWCSVDVNYIKSLLFDLDYFMFQ